MERPQASELTHSKTTPESCREFTQTDLGFHLKKLTRAISQRTDEMLRPTELRSGQVALLAVTHEEGSATIFRLAERVGVDRTVLSRNLKPLVKRGLLQVKPGPDRRTRWVSLTPYGLEKLTEALPAWKKALKRIRAELGAPLTDELLDKAKAGQSALSLTG